MAMDWSDGGAIITHDRVAWFIGRLIAIDTKCDDHCRFKNISVTQCFQFYVQIVNTLVQSAMEKTDVF